MGRNEINVKLKVNEEALARTNETVKALRSAIREVENQAGELRRSLDNMIEPFVAETVPLNNEYHDEDTLPKVLAVLSSLELKNRETSYVYSASEVITMLQNEGILFRERR